LKQPFFYGFRHAAGDAHQIDWLVCWNGKSLDAALSNEAADENAFATFAYRIILNMNELGGNEHET
jgi:hypothetical protein